MPLWKGVQLLSRSVSAPPHTCSELHHQLCSGTGGIWWTDSPESWWSQKMRFLPPDVVFCTSSQWAGEQERHFGRRTGVHTVCLQSSALCDPRHWWINGPGALSSEKTNFMIFMLSVQYRKANLLDTDVHMDVIKPCGKYNFMLKLSYLSWPFMSSAENFYLSIYNMGWSD